MYQIVDKKNKGKAYMQLYHSLRENIVQEIYKYGEKLPSKRVLALESGTSVITVEHAYDILCDEGYIEARERSGYYVIYRNNDFFHGNAGYIPNEAIEDKDNIWSTLSQQRLGEAAEEGFPFSVYAKTVRHVLSQQEEGIFQKSPNAGLPILREAISAYLARNRGIIVEPKQIFIGSGAEYVYGLIVQLLGRELCYALEKPSYAKIRAVYEANGAKVEELQMGSEGILTTELQRSEAQVLHVTPYNSFPSGITASASKRREYVSWAEKRQGYIIEDDFDSEFTVSTKAVETVFSMEFGGRVIYVNTFSKSIAPSIRIGYMVLPLPLVERFNEELGFYACTVPAFEQYILAELLDSGAFERHINRVRRGIRKKNQN